MLRATLQALRRHARTSGWLRLPPRDDADVAVKPAIYLPVYEELLAGLRFRRCAILELGVWQGDSLEMWRDAFPRATVVGVDLLPPDVDLGPRVRIERADHTDAAALAEIRARHAPQGFDVIVDDGAHIGVTSARSLQALYRQHLKPGGTYIVEDWSTGYMPSWHDGGPLAEPIGVGLLDASPVAMDATRAAPVPMPSHDVGLVGVVKRLVDHVAAPAVRHWQPERLEDPLAIEWMPIHAGIVALRKPRAG